MATKTITQQGQSRIMHTFAVMIGNVDVYNDDRGDGYTRVYDGGSQPITFSLPRGQRGTATIVLIIGPTDAYMPDMGDPVYIYSFGTRVFAGTVDDIKMAWIGQDGWRTVTVTSVSLEQQFDTLRIWPARAYFNQSAGSIVTDLFNNVCQGVPVQLGTVAVGALVPTMTRSGDIVSDTFTQLSTTSTNYVWGVDPTTNPKPSLYFRDQATNIAPFTLTVNDIQWETSTYEQTRADFRDRQLTQMSFQQNLASNILFAGDGVTKIFQFPYLPASLIVVNITTSTQATAVLTFTGQPAALDYAVIGTTLVQNRYTFVTTLDNTQPNQVLIGGSSAATFQNFSDAINANPSTVGTAFSLPTQEHPTLNSANVSGSTFNLWTKVPGSGRSLVSNVGSSAFSFGSVVDGTDGTTGANLSAGTDYTWPVS